MQFTPVQQRVVGSLVEKELTTPDHYPLSMNALLAACNQTTNRDPVVQLDERVVGNALENLKAEGVVRVVFSKGNRVDKYRHVLPEKLDVNQAEIALLAVLLLRGPQTAAELRARTERLHGFGSTDEVEAVLQRLAGRDPALVTLLARQSGRKEPRWSHLLGPAPSESVPAPVAEAPVPPPEPAPDRLAALEARVAALEERLDQLHS